MAGCSHDILGTTTCWATLPIWTEATNSMILMTSVKQKARVGGFLVIHLTAAVVEAVSGCVTFCL